MEAIYLSSDDFILFSCVSISSKVNCETWFELLLEEEDYTMFRLELLLRILFSLSFFMLDWIYFTG